MSSSDVSKAAAELVAAFGAHQRAAYFDAFAPAATFLFYNYPRLLNSRMEYESVWDQWEREGFRVLGCDSSDQHFTFLNDEICVFTHTVRTTLREGEGSICTGERETIVFQLIGGRWLGVHEHLSSDPTFS